MVTLGGAAMSKSRGNTIEPSETIKAYGADTTRMFQLFAAPPEKQLEWSDKGVVGSWKFLNRVWHLAEGYSRQSKGVSASVTAAAAGEAGFSQSPKESAAADNAGQSCDSRAGSAPADAQAAKRLLRRLNRTVKKVTEDMESGYKFNTAISSIMELVNEMQSYPAGDPVYKESLEKLILLLAPFAPHICEELWESIGGKGGLASASWPAYDESLIEEEFCEIVIQVNGRVRSRMSLPKGADESSVRKSALTDEKLSVFLKGGVRKFVFVKDKLLNIVTG
jgi:leucyl-tRNA synthetase